MRKLGYLLWPRLFIIVTSFPVRGCWAVYNNMHMHGYVELCWNGNVAILTKFPSLWVCAQEEVNDILCRQWQKNRQNDNSGSAGKNFCATVTTIILRKQIYVAWMILGLRSANERRRYFVTTSLIGWVRA